MCARSIEENRLIRPLVHRSILYLEIFTLSHRSNRTISLANENNVRPVALERELKYSQKLLALGYFTVEKVILYSRLLG